ncbi:MAG TPA: hypothetical protein VFW50_10840 [Streptosporangiaceae bacterium]|nr:hypothetical protein [Streptosporangiaceae bacterium]
MHRYAAAARWKDKDQGIWEIRGEPRNPRMKATIDATAGRLTDKRGLVYRYLSRDGLAGETLRGRLSERAARPAAGLRHRAGCRGTGRHWRWQP